MSTIFISDNSSGVHEKIMDKLQKANQGFAFPYGSDNLTKKAVQKFRELFDRDVDVYFTTNGTSANIIGLSAILRSFESVVCAETTHINTDECGAFEKFIGAKIITIKHSHGKIISADIEKHLLNKGNEHHNQPKVISISQCTELGAVYSASEIKALAEFAHKNDMYLHLDGARIANAAVATGLTIKEMITDTGVDILSFGGTKNGMMFGEAIIFFDRELSKNMKYIRKQGMQLISKMRFVSAQFLAYLEDDLWIKNAERANLSAKYLKDKLSEIDGIEIMNDVDANMIFARIPQALIDEMISREYFYVIDPGDRLIRLVTSFNTKKEDMDYFLAEAIEFLKK